jgi:peptidoglycan/LPS O-acetylase OafA/YrhL
MKYRPEIDGLRAVAVIPVLLYHAGFSWVSGGYVGVDVFFVISGYLITSILIDEILAGRFSIWGFYERRARRILPALCFVMLACVPFAWMWMLPDQFKDFGQSIVAVVFFASNILFWRESGYFEASAEEKPLLHTWSLAVEEQYYLLFPLFLLLALRHGKQRVFGMICVMAVISYCITELGWRHRPVANFYLLPSRIWELLAGSLSAFIVTSKGVRSNQLYAAMGGFMILYGVFLFDYQTPFPSSYTLLPVIGAVLVILYAGTGTLINKVLSLRPVVGIGLISYSIYLWHQPLFAFARIRLVQELSQTAMIILCGLSIILAYLTWAYVEQPFRRKSGWELGRKQMFFFSGGVLLLFAIFGAWAHVQNGAAFRLPVEVRGLMTARTGDSTLCHNGLTHSQISSGKICMIGNVDHKPTIAVMGDSHAARISDAFSDLLNLRGQAAVLYNGSWCAPLMHFATNAAKKDGCVRNMNASFEYVIAQADIETVVIFAEWSNYTSGVRYGAQGADSYVFDINGDFVFKGAVPSGNVDQFEKAVTYTFGRMKQANKQVVLVMPTPEFNFHVPKNLAKLALFDNSQVDLPAMNKTSYAERNNDAISILKQYATEYGFEIIYPFPVFCKPERCAYADNMGQALFEDDNHLNYNGAQMLVQPILQQIASQE